MTVKAARTISTHFANRHQPGKIYSSQGISSTFSAPLLTNSARICRTKLPHRMRKQAQTVGCSGNVQNDQAGRRMPRTDQWDDLFWNHGARGFGLRIYPNGKRSVWRVLADQFELVSVCPQTREPMRNKAAATQQEQRRGSA